MLTRIASALVFSLLGFGFVALIIVELRLGVAGAKFGAASLHHSPGTFSFFIAMQAFLAIFMFASATGAHVKASPLLRRAVIAALAVILILFAWTILETARDMLAAGAQMALEDRWVLGGIGVMLLVVMCTIGYQLIWLEIRDRLR